jgi:RHS repeat-associated protein
MTNDGNNTLVYDAENRLLSATNGGASGTYTYDGNNLRVKKVSGSITTIYIFSGAKVLAEYDNGAAVGSPSREYIYSGNTLLTKIEGSTTKYFHPDHLSARVVTGSSGNILEQHGHYPFGEPWYDGAEKWKFTSYERDSESGNDFARMRFSVNRLARFSSPDRLAGSARNPQSLNHYTYTQNDPVNLTDPNGLTPRMYVCGGGFDPVQITNCFPWGSGGGGGGSCTLNGIVSPCGIVQSLLGAGSADQCPANICEFANGAFYRFRGFADGSSGYIRSNAPSGWSFGDFSNATSAVTTAANGTPTLYGDLKPGAKAVYDLLTKLGVSPDDIQIYENGDGSFAAVLTEAGFDQLEQSSLVGSNFGDAFLHYPYTDGARSDQDPSLHFVWFDPTLTDAVGGSGVYMQFHSDSSNPWNGGFWHHWGCDVFHITCGH